MEVVVETGENAATNEVKLDLNESTDDAKTTNPNAEDDSDSDVSSSSSDEDLLAPQIGDVGEDSEDDIDDAPPKTKNEILVCSLISCLFPNFFVSFSSSLFFFSLRFCCLNFIHIFFVCYRKCHFRKS
jgi:hypothetical protein